MLIKKIYLFVFTGLLFTITGFSQVTVTNPTNTTPNLAATYTSLANAITALDAITAISGPVTITLNAGNPQTAPAGGYVIQFTTPPAGISATNNITIDGSNNTITASAALTAGRLYDGIFKIIGADYITIQDFTMQENPANTTTPSATNNMTEWGVAILHASFTDGAQHNTIQNNTISLNRAYQNTFGIYSNGRHSATSISGVENITNITGSNFANKVYANNISNVGYGIVFVGSTTSAFMDDGNDIGGSSAATGNTITNWGGINTTISSYVSVTTSSFCIYVNNQINENVSYNTITSATVTGATFTFGGIFKAYSTITYSGAGITSTINNNTITLSSTNVSGTMDGILNQNLVALSTATFNMNNNTIANCSISGAGTSSSFFGISNTSAPGVLNINDNAVRGCTSTATTGGFTGIQNTGAVVTTCNINNNQLGNGVTGPITFSAVTNNTIIGITNTNGTAGETISLSNNSIDGISCLQSGTITGYSISGAANANLTVTGNSFLNTAVSGAGATGSNIVGISCGSAAATTSITSNIIRGHTSTSTTGAFTGIQNTGAVTTTCNINNNQLGNGVTSPITYSVATSNTIIGISNSNGTAGETISLSNNTIDGISCLQSGTITGYSISGGGNTNLTVTGNSFLNTAVSGAGATGSSIVGIINSSAAATISITSNIIRGHTSTSTTGAFTGIQNTGGVTTTCNIDNNQLGNGITGPITYSVATSSAIIGITNSNATAGETISLSGNTIDGISCVTASSVVGISNTGGTATTNVTISSNSVLNTVISGTGSTMLTCISNTAAVANLTANSNTIRGHSSASTTAGFVGIQNTGGVTGTIDISTNQVGNASGPAITMSSTTTGSVWGISNTNGMAATNLNVTNNTMERFNAVSSFTVIGVINSGSPGGTININDNSFGNATANFVTLSAAQNAAVSAVQNQQAGAGSTLNINNNNVDRISAVSNISNTYIIYNSSSNPTTININNNNLGSTTGSLVTYSAASTGAIYGIINLGAVGTLNTNFNKIDGISIVTSGQINGIYNLGNVTTAINVEHNSFGSTSGAFLNSSGAQSNPIYVVFNAAGAAAATSSIQYNDIRGIVHAVTASATHQYLSQLAAASSTIISNNTFTNLVVNTSGPVILIGRSGNLASGASITCSNNSIVTGFSKTASGNNFYGYVSIAASVNGSIMTETGNNFSNVTVTGSTNIYMWNNEDGVSVSNGPTKTITGNTFNNISFGSGAVFGFYLGYGAATNCSNNTISNVSGTGSIFGISNDVNDGQGTVSYSNNTITNLSSTGTGGNITGITGGFQSVPTTNISGNTLTGFSSTGVNAGVVGISSVNGQVVNTYDNQISNLSGTGTGFPTAYGIIASGGTTVNVYRNKIHTISESGVISASSPAVNGMSINDVTTFNAYNNFISNLNAPNASLDNAINGINLISAAASTSCNLYYNSIYLNASSTGTNFGSSGIYHLTNATATTGTLNMIDNIIVNTSTPNGTGVTTAYRRSDATLTNFAATSDYNLFYAGTPSASRLIFYDGTNSDQTLAAYQTRVSTRDANSISVLPTFTSSTDLHLTSANCRIDGRGTPIGSVTTDIDAAARNATTPDIGADEFTATTSTSLAGSAGSAVCEDRTVSGTGTTYTSNACDLIAYVLPSGGAPVAGKVNACVTIDATQQTFNAQPYVQRHFDIEPSVSPSTATATVTLYFADAEFALYNTTNPAWPKLPTAATGGNASPYITNVKVTQFHGLGSTSPTSPGNYPGTTTLITPVTTNYNGTYWELTFNVVGFSGFYVHTNNFNAPLPIVVNYLTGHKQGSNHLLNWKVTCTSTPKATMTLERSSDARNYSGIYNIIADAVRCQQPFDYTDADPLKGMNYYRLKIVDADGHVTYSTTVALLNAVKGFDIISIAPNPVVSNNFKLNVASAQSGKMEFVIFDVQGRLVTRQSISLIAGFNSMPVNVANLAPGTYTIKGSMADDQSRVMRFVKQ